MKHSTATRQAGTRRKHRGGRAHWRGRRHRAARLAPFARASGGAIARAAVNRRACTLLELVQSIQPDVSSDAELVTIVKWLINSGAVVLTGSFAGQRI
jgi:hypothetical protein